MATLLTNLKIVLPALLLLNAALLFFFKNPGRLIKGPFILFAVLLLLCLIYRFFVFPAVTQRVQAAQQQEIKKQGWEYINDPELDHSFARQQQENLMMRSLLYRLIGLQAAFAFVFATIGFFTAADRKLYGLYALGFFMLAFLFLR